MKDSIWADTPRQVPRHEAERIATHEVRDGRLMTLHRSGGNDSPQADRPPGENR